MKGSDGSHGECGRYKERFPYMNPAALRCQADRPPLTRMKACGLDFSRPRVCLSATEDGLKCESKRLVD